MSDITKKILIVDDEPNVLSALKRQFGKRFEIDTATTVVGTCGICIARRDCESADRCRAVRTATGDDVIAVLPVVVRYYAESVFSADAAVGIAVG